MTLLSPATGLTAARAPAGAEPGWTDSRNPARYFPALDGLRALAVASVVLYHLGFRWAGGGYIGVDVFFVLSGYLITSLLIAHKRRTGEAGLRSFWARRARRLLPALFLMLIVISLAAYADRARIALTTFRADALATLFYIANWHQILSHQSYFAQFAAPSPLSHTWSLAIEEQFYIIWPLIVAGCLAAATRISRSTARTAKRNRLGLLPIATLLLACTSAGAMAFAYHGQTDTSVVYYSTVTRAFELLAGAILAILVLDRTMTTDSPSRRRAFTVSGLLALGGLATIFTIASGPPGWMYRGGFVAVTLLSATLIAAIGRARPGSVGRIFSFGPIRYLGRISYGIYLWHWPVIVFLSPQALHWATLPLDLLRIALTLGFSVLSFHVLEVPVRRTSLAGWRRRALVPLAAAATAGVIVVATVPPTTVPVAGAAEPISGHDPPSRAGDLPARVAGGPYPVSPDKLPPISPVPDSAHPLRIMVVGDSVMWTAEPALAAALQSTRATVVDSAAFFGWGLTTSKDWRPQISALVAQYRPDVVAGTWSWDNTDALDHPATYRALLDSFVKYVTTPGNGVRALVLLQFPAMGPLWAIDPSAERDNPTRIAGVGAWNAAARTVASKHPGKVLFAEVAASVEVKHRFSAWLPNGTGGWTRARMIDNTHFCPWGAAVFASAVTSTLDPILGLPHPSGTWWSGVWTADSRYAQANGFPGGACPDDKPPPTAR